MNATFEQLIQLLDEREIGYSADAEEQTTWMHLRGDVGLFRIAARVADDLFQVVGFIPIFAPSGSRSAMAEAVTRANDGMKVGKFELNCDDGNLRFQASQIVTESGLEAEIIDRLIGTTLAMLDRYVPAFLSVIYGNESPADAIRYAEAAPSEPETPPEDSDV